MRDKRIAQHCAEQALLFRRRSLRRYRRERTGADIPQRNRDAADVDSKYPRCRNQTNSRNQEQQYHLQIRQTEGGAWFFGRMALHRR